MYACSAFFIDCLWISWTLTFDYSGAACPGVIVKNSAALNDRCTKPGYFLNYKKVSKPIELLIIVQKTNFFRQISLWWSYTPNPTRQVNTCQLANNGVCDYDSGKCLTGTDCSDCGGSNCQATECISAHPHSSQLNLPETCDDPEWKSLPATRSHVGSKGPWDCQSLEREMRMDCSGCRCEIQGGTNSLSTKFHSHYQPCFCLQGIRFECNCYNTTRIDIWHLTWKIWWADYAFACSMILDPCTDEVKRQCRASNREICERGSGECGECLDGYTLRANTTICERKYGRIVVSSALLGEWVKWYDPTSLHFPQTQSKNILFMNRFGVICSLKCCSQSVRRCGQRGLSNCQQRDLRRRCGH